MPTTGTDLPEELFADIIRHLQIPEWYEDSAAADVLPCTLVCLFWAKHCRRLIWPRLNIDIASQTRAEGFRRICLSPPRTTARLEPLADLVFRVNVTHAFRDDARPWLHQFFLSTARVPRGELAIRDPVPASVPLASLQTPSTSRPRTPYWGIPRSLPRTIAKCRYFWLQDM